jgi:hypothetical protein
MKVQETHISTWHCHTFLGPFIHILQEFVLYSVTYKQLTISKVRSRSSEAHSYSDVQKVHHLLRNPKIHHRKSQPTDTILSHFNPIRILIHYSFKIPYLYKPLIWLIKGCRPLRLFDQNFVCILASLACYMPRPSNPPLFDRCNNIWFATLILRVVTGEKNSPTVAHACRKRRLKWVLRRLGVGAQG